MSQMPMASDVNDNDKLIAALSYFFTPIVPVIVLLVDTMKARTYQKYHALNALGLFGGEVIFYSLVCILTIICSVVTLGLGSLLGCVAFLAIIPNIYYTIIAYSRPAYFEIPVVTKFMKQQGWLTV